MSTKAKPTKTASRGFFAASRKPHTSPSKQNLETDIDDPFCNGPRLRSTARSTSYTSPLDLGDISQLSQNSAPLTEHNLRGLLQDLENKKSTSAPPSIAKLSSAAGEQGHMRKAKSKKSDKKKSKAESDSHPLNLPPDELRRLSAAMARDEGRTSTPMDLDSEEPVTNGASEPSTPSHDAPGAFPNGDGDEANGHDEKSPTPPPHKTPAPPPVDPEACKAAGNKFFKAKDYNRAIQEYSKAVDAEPSNSTYLSNRAAAYISANKFDLALSDSLKASRIDPSDKVLHRLARIYTQLGRPADALETYSRISNASATDTSSAQKAKTSIDSAERQIYSEDGNGNMALWSIDQAKQTLGAGTSMPRNWQILRAKANLKIGSINALGEAQGITQSLMRLDPNDTDAMFLAGKSFYLKDERGAGKSDFERAEMYFKQALSMDPDNSDARSTLRTMKKLGKARDEANAIFKRGRYSEAIKLYTECLEIDPLNKITNAKLLGNRATARMKIKEYEEAQEDCNKALKLDPSYSKAKRTRAKALGESGDWEQAVKDLKQLLEQDSDDADLKKAVREAEIELKKSKRKDYYKILGIDKDAGEKDIERAYKKKAALLHPDKTGGDAKKEEEFKGCLEAKEILLDPQKRQMFDSGVDLDDPTSGMGGGGGFPGGGMGGGMQIDPEILMQMFGGGMGGGMPRGGGGGGMPHFTFQQGGGGGRGGGFPF